MPVGNDQLLFTFHEKGSLFSGGFDRPCIDQELCFPVFLDVEPVEAFFHHVKRAVRSMNSEAHIFVDITHPQEYAPGKQIELDRIVSFSRESDKINLSVAIDPDVVLVTEVNFCTTFPRSELVSFDNG
jgi:hypothetical protein